MKIITTVRVCDQIGPNDFKMKAHSRVFHETTQIYEILLWASKYIEKPTINDIDFSMGEGM